jgi:molecular chaperone GrpE (heat shock protein)
MRDRTPPILAKWPFFLADMALLGAAWLIFWQSRTPMTAWDAFFCAACVALGAVLGVAPYLLEYRAVMRLTEADRLAQAVLQIENIEIVGRQINQATAGWQTAHEQATKTVEAAREIAEGITTEARAFSDFLRKSNDAEKSHLRLEVDKLRRSENEWLQILVRILDHIFVLYQAAVRSGQPNLAEQLGQFQNACRDTARRVGLVAFVAIPGEPYDLKVHQLADASIAPAGEARIAQTIATGYSFQGQLLRPALVSLLAEEGPRPQEPADVSADRLLDQPAPVVMTKPE